MVQLRVLMQVGQGAGNLPASGKHLTHKELTFTAIGYLSLQVIVKSSVATQLSQQKALIAVLISADDLHYIGVR